KYHSSRADTGNQIRSRIGDFGVQCTLPVLPAISAIGIRLCFHKLINHEMIDPLCIVADLNQVMATVPKDLWDCDILEEGFELWWRRSRGLM
ncbi:hypothetical protein F5887DRAFT_888030, partial [Amanita rubescens]